jgi:hypothetical protein
MLIAPFQLAVYAELCSDETGCGYFSDPTHFFIQIPNGWSSNIRDGNLVLTGQGAEFEVSSGPLNGAPLEQVRSRMITEDQNNPNLSFTHTQPITTSWGSGHYYQYKELQGTENEREIDSWLLENNGRWYAIRYSVPSSQYDVAFRNELMKTMVVGAQYDQVKEAASSGQTVQGAIDEANQLNYCQTKKSLDLLGGPDVDASGMAVTHTDPQCPGYTFNGPG